MICTIKRYLHWLMYDMSVEWTHGNTHMVHIAPLKLVNAYSFFVTQDPESDHMFTKKFIILPKMHYMKLFPYIGGLIEANIVSSSQSFGNCFYYRCASAFIQWLRRQKPYLS